MGKTSLALAALHHPYLSFHLRLFVACDSGIGEDCIADALGVVPKRSAILRTLAELDRSTVIVLDNWESVWEPAEKRAPAESLLGAIAEIAHVTIIVTMRGSERPLGVAWSRPFLKVLSPLDSASAMQTFLAISNVSEDDEHLLPLLEKLGNLPLAVTLIASIAQYEPLESILERWNAESTAIAARADGAGSKTSSLNVSLELSLHSPRLKIFPGAFELLSMLSILPDGIFDDRLPLIDPELRSTHLRYIDVLLKTCLAYRDSSNRLRVLPPIREFILDRYTPTAVQLQKLLQHHSSYGRAWGKALDGGEDADASQFEETEQKFLSELGNIHSVLYYMLKHRICLADALRAVKHLRPTRQRSRDWDYVFELAIERAREQEDELLLADCLATAARHMFKTVRDLDAQRFVDEPAPIYRNYPPGPQLAYCVYAQFGYIQDDQLARHRADAEFLLENASVGYYMASCLRLRLAGSVRTLAEKIAAFQALLQSHQGEFHYEFAESLGHLYRHSGRFELAQQYLTLGLKARLLPTLMASLTGLSAISSVRGNLNEQ